MQQELHSAHFGVVKTKSTARSKTWWPSIDADIEWWIGACKKRTVGTDLSLLLQQVQNSLYGNSMG